MSVLTFAVRFFHTAGLDRPGRLGQEPRKFLGSCTLAFFSSSFFFCACASTLARSLSLTSLPLADLARGRAGASQRGQVRSPTAAAGGDSQDAHGGGVAADRHVPSGAGGSRAFGDVCLYGWLVCPRLVCLINFLGLWAMGDPSLIWVVFWPAPGTNMQSMLQWS